MAAEQTIFTTMDLPEGKDIEWFPDLNVVGLSSRLDCEGRMRAVNELSVRWRREAFRLIESA